MRLKPNQNIIIEVELSSMEWNTVEVKVELKIDLKNRIENSVDGFES